MKPTALMQLKAVSVCGFGPVETKLNLNQSSSSQPPHGGRRATLRDPINARELLRGVFLV